MTDYTTGTITLTSGSTAFTTSGAALVSAAIRPGDAILRNGRFLVIASITGENAGTLAEECPADAAGTGVALRIRFQSDISRFSVKQAELIASLSGGNAQSFSGLDGSGGNKGLHFTGSGTLATHVLTAAARTFLNLNVSPAADRLPYFSSPTETALATFTAASRAILNPTGSAAADRIPYLTSASAAAYTPFTAAARALANLSGSPVANRLPYLTGASTADLAVLTAFARSIMEQTDATNARATLDAQRVSRTVATSADDWNTIVEPGWHDRLLGTANANAPQAGTFFYCLVLRHAATDQNLTQLAFPYRDVGAVFCRIRAAGTWGAWRRLIDTSQTGGSGANVVPLFNVNWTTTGSITLNKSSAGFEQIDGAVHGRTLMFGSSWWVGTVSTHNFNLFVGNGNPALTVVAGTNAVHFPLSGTTASAANAFLDSSSTPANRLLRSTSSLTYKRDIEDLEAERADAFIEQARPVWYRSRAEPDNPNWGWYGLIAEEVAEIDPRLVHWGYQEHQYETFEVEFEDEEGETQTRTDLRLKEGEQKVPDGVQYDRLTVLLLDVVQRQREAIAELTDRVAALEAEMVSPGG